MSAASVMARGRAAAEALMTDACVITRVTGHQTDPHTGVVTDTTATIYSGICAVQQPGGEAVPATVAGAYRYQQTWTLKLPMASSTGIAAEDMVEVTASTTDPDLVGRRWWVRELAAKTYATARRLGIVEVTS